MVRFDQNDIASVQRKFVPFLESARAGGCKHLKRVVATRVTHKISAWGTWVRRERQSSRASANRADTSVQETGGERARLGLYGGITPDGTAEWIWKECHPVHADVLWELETRELGDDLRVRGY
jgi:hypothetical protein